ncbi:MAG TPA: VOC family protein [Candidatus Eremiobacteraeota bacterium]|nr:MAG: putative lyase [bacterium ADurb.Bin363]HPZ08666.1 VOC family protein [Candidatus Eremiobacteraeota bacterium]
MIKRLDHISILAKEPEKVIDFYKNFLGFEVISKKEVPSMNMNIFLLKGRDEIIEILQPTKETKMEDGLKHMAFLSDNIDEDFKFFKEHSAILIHKEVQHMEKLKFFFVKGPAGELVEIIQHL